MKNTKKETQMSDLKPCPFCGGDAKLRHDYSSESGGWYVIDCLHHGCMRSERSEWEGQQVSTGWRKTKSEATEAWNTRAERTCMLASTQLTHHGPYGNIYHTHKIVCSECRHDMPEHGDSIQYCPKCGCRVRSNDE